MTEKTKTAEQRFAAAVAELNALTQEGFVIAGLRPMAMSATARTVTEAPKPESAKAEKPPVAFGLKVKDEGSLQ